MSYEGNFSLKRWHPGQHLDKRLHSDSHLLFFMMPLGVDQGLITKTQLGISFAKGHSTTFMDVVLADMGNSKELPIGMDELHVLPAAIHKYHYCYFCHCYGAFDKDWRTAI